MRTILAAVAGMAIAASPLAAQVGSTGNAGGLSGLLGSGGGGLLGGVLPGVGSTTVGNAAGLLGYCVQNQLLGQASGASSALDLLRGKPGVTASPGYQAGTTGTVVAGQGQSFSLDQVKGRIKTKVCQMVLQRAKSFL